MGVLVWNNLVKALSWGRLSSYLVTVVARCEYINLTVYFLAPNSIHKT